ncbi:MAG: nucleotidyltransferase family protein, partial [Infirmifilum sp.]
MNVIEALQKEIQSTLVVVMAGGEGKRMGYTGTPKPLIPISGVSLLDRCITFLASNGFKRFVILTRQDKVVEHVSGTDYKVELKVCRDPQVPRVGKGKALAYALRTGCLNPEERILIAFPDDIFTDESLPLRFIASHVEAVKRLGVWASVAVVAALQLPYGVVELDPAGLATKFEEKPRLSIYASTGLYIF